MLFCRWLWSLFFSDCLSIIVDKGLGWRCDKGLGVWGVFVGRPCYLSGQQSFLSTFLHGTVQFNYKYVIFFNSFPFLKFSYDFYSNNFIPDLIFMLKSQSIIKVVIFSFSRGTYIFPPSEIWTEIFIFLHFFTVDFYTILF